MTKLVIVCDGYKSAYDSLLGKVVSKDLVIVKNYRYKNTTETVKIQDNLLEILRKFKFQHVNSCLLDGLRRAISLLVDEFGEILILNSTIPLLDSKVPFDGLALKNDLQEIGMFLKNNGILVSLISTLKGYTLLENWVDFVNSSQTIDSSPAGSGLVVKLTPKLRKIMIETNSNPTINLETPISSGNNIANLAFLQSQMQAYQQHVAKNQLMLSSAKNTTQEDEISYIWSGVLSWKGLDPTTNLTREISCNVMAIPVHKRDISEYFLDYWPSKLVMASVLPLQTEFLQAHVKSNNLPLVKIVPSSHQTSFSNLLNILSTRKVASVVRFNGDFGLLMVENAGKLIAFVCVKVGLSVISRGY